MTAPRIQYQPCATGEYWSEFHKRYEDRVWQGLSGSKCCLSKPLLGELARTSLLLSLSSVCDTRVWCWRKGGYSGEELVLLTEREKPNILRLNTDSWSADLVSTTRTIADHRWFDGEQQEHTTTGLVYNSSNNNNNNNNKEQYCWLYRKEREYTDVISVSGNMVLFTWFPAMQYCWLAIYSRKYKTADVISENGGTELLMWCWTTGVQNCWRDIGQQECRTAEVIAENGST